MKVLYLVTDDWYFWTHRLSLARRARDAGYEVVVATRPSEYAERIESEGFALRPIHLRRTLATQPWNAIALARLVALLREERPALIHDVAFLPVFFGSIAARLAGVRAVVNTIPGLGHVFISREGKRLVRSMIEWGYRLACSDDRTAALFQNRDDLELFRDRGLVHESRAVLVPGSGVCTERFRPSPVPRGRPTVLLASRMLWSKGVRELVEASRILRSRGVAHRLRLAGRPHPSNPDSIPEETLRAWSATGEVEWLGHRDDVPELLGEASVVCLPSYYREGVPMTLLEAAACGRPVVTTDRPGCRDTVIDGESGLLVPPRDARALAGALESLLVDPERCERMGVRGRALVEERFSDARVNAQVLEVYAALGAEPRRSGAAVDGLSAPCGSTPRRSASETVAGPDARR